MRILLLNQHYYPEIAATAQLITDLAEDIVQKGMKVTVVTGFPSYFKFDSADKSPGYEEHNGVKIYRVFTTSFDKKKKWGRIVNYLSFYCFALLKTITIKKHDIVITMSTPPYLAFFGVILKKVKGVKFVYWVQDIYPDLAVAFGVIKKNSLINKILQKFSTIIYKEAHSVVAIGETMADCLYQRGVCASKTSVIHNWADPKDFETTNTNTNLIRKQLNLSDKFVILYSGNMGVVHEFETAKSAILALKNRSDIRFVFIGAGVKKAELENFAKTNQCKNVMFLPYQPRNMLRHSIKAGNVFLITLDKKASGLVVPSKIYGAMAAELPIIAIGPQTGELHNIVEQYNCGISLAVGNKQGFIDAINKFCDEKGFQQMCSQKSKDAFCKNFSRQVATDKFINLLLSLKD